MSGIKWTGAGLVPKMGGKVKGVTTKSTAPMKTPTKQVATRKNTQPQKGQRVAIKSPVMGKKVLY